MLICCELRYIHTGRGALRCGAVPCVAVRHVASSVNEPLKLRRLAAYLFIYKKISRFHFRDLVCPRPFRLRHC